MLLLVPIFLLPFFLLGSLARRKKTLLLPFNDAKRPQRLPRESASFNCAQVKLPLPNNRAGIRGNMLVGSFIPVCREARGDESGITADRPDWREDIY